MRDVVTKISVRFFAVSTRGLLPLPMSPTAPLLVGYIGARPRGPSSMAWGLAREKKRAAGVEGRCGGLCVDVDCRCGVLLCRRTHVSMA